MTVERDGNGRIGSRERALLILLVVVAALGGAFFVLTSGGDEDDEPDAVGPTRPPVTASPTASPSPTEAPPETDERFEGKDPFEPLIIPELTTGGTGGTGGTAGTGGTTGGTGGNTTGGTGNGTDGASPGPTARPGDGNDRVRVTLLDIFRDNGERLAIVDVDGTEYTVAEGETFADNFRVIDLTSKCGTFVFGDERFTLCLGQEVLK